MDIRLREKGVPAFGGVPFWPKIPSTQEAAKYSLAEVGLVLGLLVLTIWVAPLLSVHRATVRQIGVVFGALTGLVVIGSALLHENSLPTLGLRLDNFPAALRVLALPTLLLSALLVGIGAGFHSLRLSPEAFSKIHLDWYGWLLVQQFLLQAFLNLRLQEVYGKSQSSVIFAAVVFAGLHLPNPALMLATLIAGIFWTRAFQRVPNLFALALSHFVLSFLLRHTLPLWILPNAKIGWAFHW